MSVDNERPTPGQENEIDARSILVARFVDESLLPKVDWQAEQPINDSVRADIDISLMNVLNEYYYYGAQPGIPRDISLRDITRNLERRMRHDHSHDKQLELKLSRAYFAVGRLIFDGWTPAIQSNDTDHR